MTTQQRRVLARVSTLPVRPAWASKGPTVGHGSWSHTVATIAGPLIVRQLVTYRHESSTWEISAASVDLSAFDELGATGCRVLTGGLAEAGRVVARANREARALVQRRGVEVLGSILAARAVMEELGRTDRTPDELRVAFPELPAIEDVLAGRGEWMLAHMLTVCEWLGAGPGELFARAEGAETAGLRSRG